MSSRELLNSRDGVNADWDSVESTVWGVKTELARRLAEIGLPETTVPCQGILSNRADQPNPLQKRYAHLLPSSSLSPYISQPQGFYIALNLWMSQKILPHVFENLLSLCALLGPANVHIAIFENGSWDETPNAMAHFARALSALGVAHTIRSDPHSTDWSRVDRIEQLAVFRNVALSPLLSYSPSSSPPLFLPSRSIDNATLLHPDVPTDVVFINDVYFCPADVLELLHQRRFQGASATCGLDWRPAPEGSLWGWANGWLSPNYRFYDNWVTRSMEGFPLRPRVDIFGELRDGLRELFHWDSDPTHLIRFRAGLPTPVYSCWNGLIALSALPFLPLSSGGHALQFRGGDTAAGECAASECKLVARDFWGVGEKRWVLVPRVAVTYEAEAYKSEWIEDKVRRGGVAGMERDLEEKTYRHAPTRSMPLEERIDWDMVKDPEKVICFPYHKGERLEVWPFYREGASMNSTKVKHPQHQPAHLPLEDIFG